MQKSCQVLIQELLPIFPMVRFCGLSFIHNQKEKKVDKKMDKNSRIILLIAGILCLLLFSSPTRTLADSFAASVDFTGFDGSGFAPVPTGGQLDSDTWATDGFSAENASFEGSCTSGDCARGSSTGGVGIGGIYAFDVGGGNMILGVQPGGSDFTPGTITMRLKNNTGAVVTSVNVSYDIYYYNDQARSNSLNFAYSEDGSNFTSVPVLDWASPGIADPLLRFATWQSVGKNTTITGINVADSDPFFIQWQGDDVSGSGSRDEMGIDNITVTTLDPAAVSLQSAQVNITQSFLPFLLTFLAISVATFFGLQRKTR